MFVLAQVSSMKTSRAGSRRPWRWRHRLRRRATSGGPARRRGGFFLKLIPSARKKRHTTEIATTTPRCRSSAASTAKVRSGFSVMRTSSHALPRQRRAAHAAHRAGGDTSRHPLPRGPPDHARRAERKPGRHRSATLAGPDRSNSAFTSIQRQSSCHPCWPPHEEHLRSQGRRVAGSRSIQQVEKSV
jgi:hypothetical protein